MSVMDNMWYYNNNYNIFEKIWTSFMKSMNIFFCMEDGQKEWNKIIS